MKKLFLIILILFVTYSVGSLDPDKFEYFPEEFISFQEISQPYFEKYGMPEKIMNEENEACHLIIWMWESQNFFVMFAHYIFNDTHIHGWTVICTYSN